MVKGQSALAYLVMVAAVLTITITAVVIAQSILSPAEAANLVVEDKYRASMMGAELVDYQKPYNGADYTAPAVIVYKGEPHHVALNYSHPKRNGPVIFELGYNKYLGKFKVYNQDSYIGIQSFSAKLCEKGVILYNEMFDVDLDDDEIDTLCIWYWEKDISEDADQQEIENKIMSGIGQIRISQQMQI